MGIKSEPRKSAGTRISGLPTPPFFFESYSEVLIRCRYQTARRSTYVIVILIRKSSATARGNEETNPKANVGQSSNSGIESVSFGEKVGEGCEHKVVNTILASKLSGTFLMFHSNAYSAMYKLSMKQIALLKRRIVGLLKLIQR